MRRYELMLILRPDVTEERTKAIFERTTRSITEQGGTILKDEAHMKEHRLNHHGWYDGDSITKEEPKW